MTPSFHAQRPRAASFYGGGASSPPKIRAWQRYVRTVVRRYGSAASYQVWNEANVTGFWSGSQAEMARLTKATYDVVRSVSRTARVVAPAYVTRTATQRRLLGRFYAQRVAGRPVASFVDVVSLQLYPSRTGTPETSMQALAADRAILAARGVRKPIWNTEINYGLVAGRVAAKPGDVQRAYVARTFLLNAASGIQRVFWYAWDSGNVANTRMTYSSGAVGPGGTALRVVRGWMTGQRMHTCQRLTGGTYLCTLTSSGSVRRVFWNPSRTASVGLPVGARTVHRLDGSSSRATGERLRVNSTPVMVQSPR
jgi:hypothetical protein